MIARPSLALPFLFASLAAMFAPSPVRAADIDFSPTRAEVRAETAAARLRGGLLPPGERSFADATGRGIGSSRADVRASVLQASVRGELMPAGDRPTPYAAPRSVLARADVKDEVRHAQAVGALVAPGERVAAFEPAHDPVRTHRPRGERTVLSRR